MSGRGTLAVLTFACQSNQSGWHCGCCTHFTSNCSLHICLTVGMTLIWLPTLAMGAPDIDGINLPVLFNSTFKTSGNYSSVYWNASQTAKALSCYLLLALQKPVITNGNFHRDQWLYFNEIILVKKHFSFQAGFSLKHCLHKRTQTSFVGNYWQMNFQNTLKHVFFKVVTF